MSQQPKPVTKICWQYLQTLVTVCNVQPRLILGCVVHIFMLLGGKIPHF